MTTAEHTGYPLPEPGAVVVLDTEGNGLYADEGARVSTVSIAWRDAVGGLVAYALPFGQGIGDDAVDAGEEAWDELMEAVRSCRLVFHNAAHDLHVLNAGGIVGYRGYDLSAPFYWDTMVAARHLDPLEKVGLEATCVRLGIAEPWKEKLDADLPKLKKADVYKELRATEEYGGSGKREGQTLTQAKRADAEARRIVAERDAQRVSYDTKPWPIVEPYATDDAVNTLLLLEHQLARFAEAAANEESYPSLAIAEREMELARVLYYLEERGVGFDAPGCAKVADDLAERLAKATAGLPDGMKNAEGKVTPQAVCRFYYDDLGYVPVRVDRSDGHLIRSADDLSRKGLADQGAPYIAELEGWTKLETALTSWYRPWPEKIGPDGRLRMRVRQVKVTSGRFSGERVNLLAIPHDHMLPPDTPTLRGFIHAAPGKRLYEVDLSQAEVRVGCIAAACTPLIEEYRRGEGADVYALAALEIFGETPCATHGPKGPKTCPDCAHFSHYRDLCKRLVLGTIYAMGAKTLLLAVKRFMGIDITEEESAEHLARFRERYPQFKMAERRFMRHVEEHGWVALACGERRYFQPYEQTYKALNQRIQASVAVGMKAAMREVEREEPGVMLLQTHDSLLLETDDDELPARVAAIMEATFNGIFKQVPFIAEIKEWH